MLRENNGTSGQEKGTKKQERTGEWRIVVNYLLREAEKKILMSVSPPWLPEKSLSQLKKWVRRSEDSRKALHSEKQHWVLCWVSIVPLAISAPRQEVTLCRFTIFSLKSELFCKKEETETKRKKCSWMQRGKANFYMLSTITIKSFLSYYQRNEWVNPCRFYKMCP